MIQPAPGVMPDPNPLFTVRGFIGTISERTSGPASSGRKYFLRGLRGLHDTTAPRADNQSRDVARDPGRFAPTKGKPMHETSDARNATGPTHHTCVDCGATILVTGGPPVEFLVAQRGANSRRVVTVAGSEIHCCASVFLIGTA